VIRPARISQYETYASRRYKAGLRSWKRAIDRQLLPILGLPLVISILLGILSRETLGFLTGLTAGCCITLWIALSEEAPSYLQSWRAGAEGERRTHKEIVKLGWPAVEDVDCGRGNYDHVLVGASGIFMLETKNLMGVVEIRDGVPWLRRRHDPEGEKCLSAIAKQARGNSAALCHELERRGAGRHWVTAVVVWWTEFPQELVKAEHITHVHGTRLGDWLASHLPALSPDTVARIAGALTGLKAEGDIREQQRQHGASDQA